MYFNTLLNFANCFGLLLYSPQDLTALFAVGSRGSNIDSIPTLLNVRCAAMVLAA